MPTITDWLMLGITVVYVVATIFICVANIRSAQVSQAQLAEMKHQYEENQRVSLIPYLNICKCEEVAATQGEAICWLTEPCTENFLETTVIFQLTNCGPGIAVESSYVWKRVEYSNRYTHGVESLSAGGRRNLKVTFYACKPDKASGADWGVAYIDISFFDLFGNQYLQEARICFDINSESLTIRNNTPISKPELQQSNRKEGKDV